MSRSTALIIGAGPAGLAVAACLTRAKVPYTMIERSDRVAPTWHNHYDRLHLHTARQYSELPYLGFPPGTPRYPSRLEVIAYLDAYAKRFAIAPRFGVEAHRVRRAENEWFVETAEGSQAAKFLVIASGFNHTPVRPEIAGLGEFEGPVVHTSDYRSGASYRGQRVLVLGCGNSGAEIAIDLHEHGAQPSLVVRAPVHVVPRDLFGQPTQRTSILLSKLPVRVADAVGGPIIRWAIGDLSRYGIVRPTCGVIEQIVARDRTPIIDVGTVALIKEGKIDVVPGVVRFTETTAVFADRRELPFSAVVLATGYATGLRGLIEDSADVLTPRGKPKVHGEAALPGLYFAGFNYRGTGALREIAIEARDIARSIRAALLP